MFSRGVLVLGILAFACGGSTSNDSGKGGTGGAAATGGAKGGSGGAIGGSGGATGGSGGVTGGSGGAIGGSGGAIGGSGGGNPDWFACTEPSECELFANNCCGGYCTKVPISSFTAINQKYDAAYTAANCSTTQACPGCLAEPNPNYVALCRSNVCTAVDLTTDELSACQTDTDCVLRWGAGCCAECSASGNDLIALNKNADYTGAFCGSLVPPCCAPAPFPPDALTVCQSGHCQVSFYVGP